MKNLIMMLALVMGMSFKGYGIPERSAPPVENNIVLQYQKLCQQLIKANDSTPCQELLNSPEKEEDVQKKSPNEQLKFYEKCVNKPYNKSVDWEKLSCNLPENFKENLTGVLRLVNEKMHSL